MNFAFKKLTSGEIGLKKAFWLYGNIYPFFISLVIILTIVALQEDIKISIVNRPVSPIEQCWQYSKCTILPAWMYFDIIFHVDTQWSLRDENVHTLTLSQRPKLKVVAVEDVLPARLGCALNVFVVVQLQHHSVQ